MKVFVTFRVEEKYAQCDYESPHINDTSTKIGDVFYTLEKAYEYIEQMIAKDRKETFNKYAEPVIGGWSDVDKKGTCITLVDEGYDSEFQERWHHSIEWIILEKELA